MKRRFLDTANVVGLSKYFFVTDLEITATGTSFPENSIIFSLYDKCIYYYKNTEYYFIFKLNDNGLTLDNLLVNDTLDVYNKIRVNHDADNELELIENQIKFLNKNNTYSILNYYDSDNLLDLKIYDDNDNVLATYSFYPDKMISDKNIIISKEYPELILEDVNDSASYKLQNKDTTLNIIKDTSTLFSIETSKVNAYVGEINIEPDNDINSTYTTSSIKFTNTDNVIEFNTGSQIDTILKDNQDNILNQINITDTLVSTDKALHVSTSEDKDKTEISTNEVLLKTDTASTSIKQTTSKKESYINLLDSTGSVVNYTKLTDTYFKTKLDGYVNGVLYVNADDSDKNTNIRGNKITTVAADYKGYIDLDDSSDLFNFFLYDRNSSNTISNIYLKSDKVITDYNMEIGKSLTITTSDSDNNTNITNNQITLNSGKGTFILDKLDDTLAQTHTLYDTSGNVSNKYVLDDTVFSIYKDFKTNIQNTDNYIYMTSNECKLFTKDYHTTIQQVDNSSKVTIVNYDSDSNEINRVEMDSTTLHTTNNLTVDKDISVSGSGYYSNNIKINTSDSDNNIELLDNTLRLNTKDYYSKLDQIGSSASVTLKLYDSDDTLLNTTELTDTTLKIYKSVTINDESTIAGNKIWHAGNDGKGSGLDADLVRGHNIYGYVYRNLVINSDFRYFQRPNNSITNNEMYLVDRFACKIDSGSINCYQDINKNQIQVSSDNVDVSGSNEFNPFIYRFEGSDIYKYKNSNITITFNIKSNLTGTFSLAVINKTDSDNIQSYIKTFDINDSDTYELKTITFNLDDFNDNFVNASNLSLEIIICATNDGDYKVDSEGLYDDYYTTVDGSVTSYTKDDYIQLEFLQIEEGTEFTGYEFIPAHYTLSRCQRYFEIAEASIRSFTSADQDIVTCNVNYNVNKRTNPTLILVNKDSSHLAFYQFVSQAQTQGTSIQFKADAKTSDAYSYNILYADAEL